MLEILRARLKQGHRTIAYPKQAPTLPDRFRGLPVIDVSKCPEGCRSCVEACPTDAIAVNGADFRLDLGRCLFCTDCVEACPEGAIQHGKEFRIAARRREDLIYDGRTLKLAEALDEKTRK
ncbi:MAG TPA: 4Fe-4S dicluster domain-containing protein, partial [Gemmata sp.]|nr:4Fe-4S dicluster domain-containing protein [Gemmata sp.]